MKRLLLCLFLLLSLPVVASALEYEVSYDRVRCGQPMTFTLTSSGDYHDARYQLNCIWLDYDGTPYYLFSPSATRSPYAAYRAEGRFEFTFYASGTYKLYFYMMAR